jgi:hypothetical protein
MALEFVSTATWPHVELELTQQSNREHGGHAKGKAYSEICTDSEIRDLLKLDSRQSDRKIAETLLARYPRNQVRREHVPAFDTVRIRVGKVRKDT